MIIKLNEFQLQLIAVALKNHTCLNVVSTVAKEELVDMIDALDPIDNESINDFTS
jgi:hypothetical protein